MDSAQQVVFVLQLVLALGPLAVYFLGLGLVNSQAHPCLIRARVDFLLLGIAFVPAIIAPVVALVEHGQGWLAVAVVIVVAALFFALLPGRSAGWVIYNIDAARFRRVLARACRRLDWTVAGPDDRLQVTEAALVVSLSVLPWLRSVAIRVQSSAGAGAGGRRACEQLIGALDRELQREAMLPSPTGASLVVIGAALLGLPMWYLFHHMDAIVDVVRRVLLA